MSSSETCPFCGKTYKRLKSHLPHCKAAANARTVPDEQTSSAAPSRSDASESRLKEKNPKQTRLKETSPPLKKSTKVSAASLQSSPPAPPNRTANTPPLSSDPPSTKKKKPKVSDQSKMAATPVSSDTAPISASSPAVSKRKTLQVKHDHDSASGLRSRTSVQTGTDTSPDLVKKTKPKTKKAEQALSSNPDSLDSETNKSTSGGDSFWVDAAVAKPRDSDVIEMLNPNGVEHRVRITVQDVRSMLGRTKSTAQLGRRTLLRPSETNLGVKTGLDPDPNPATENQKDAISCEKTLTQQLPSIAVQPSELQPTELQPTELQPTELQPVKKSPNSLIPLPPDHSSRSERAALSAQLSQATRLGNMAEAPKTDHTRVRPPPTFSNARLFAPAPPATSLMVETHQDRNPKAEGSADVGKRLGEVRLKELPEWLFCRAPGRPTEVVQMVQRGWQWYCRKYIHVKKGGVGGVAMLLAGYCVLSYVWNFPHIKRDRWRKYH